MQERDPYEWRCRACLDGRHLDCHLASGCEDAIRRGPGGRGFVLCEALFAIVPRPRRSP